MSVAVKRCKRWKRAGKGDAFLWGQGTISNMNVLVALNLNNTWVRFDWIKAQRLYGRPLLARSRSSSTFWPRALPKRMPNTLENLALISCLFYSLKLARTCSFHLAPYLVPHISQPPFSSPLPNTLKASDAFDSLAYPWRSFFFFLNLPKFSFEGKYKA